MFGLKKRVSKLEEFRKLVENYHEAQVKQLEKTFRDEIYELQKRCWRLENKPKYEVGQTITNKIYFGVKKVDVKNKKNTEELLVIDVIFCEDVHTFPRTFYYKYKCLTKDKEIVLVY